MLIFFATAFAFSPANNANSDQTDDLDNLSALHLSDADETFESRVVGGSPAQPGDWSSTVALIADGGYQVCTGTLIDADVVLTAAHCVVGMQITDVITGTSDLSQGGSWVPVSSQHVHPSYTTQGGSDLALLVLRSPSADPAIPIASGCLAEQRLTDGANVAIVGFGATSTDGDQATTQLHQAFSTIGDADCSEDRVNGQYTSCDPDLRADSKELFAGGEGVDACFGDSGGPLYISDDYGQWYLAGVTSRGARAADGAACGGGGVWVRPDAHLAWIEATLERDLPQPTCAPPADAPEFGPPPFAEGYGWRVIGDLLRVKPGSTATLQLRVEANNPGSLRFDITSDGAVGTATVDGSGLVTYQALDGAVGADRITIQIADSAGTRTDLDLEVRIGGGLGCSTTGGVPLWIGGVGSFLVGLRRRRG